MTDLERAARAVCRADMQRVFAKLDSAEPPTEKMIALLASEYKPYVRAALEALMEPSEAMLAAGDEQTATLQVWQAMLRAILEQSE